MHVHFTRVIGDCWCPDCSLSPVSSKFMHLAFLKMPCAPQCAQVWEWGAERPEQARRLLTPNRSGRKAGLRPIAAQYLERVTVSRQVTGTQVSSLW